MTTPHPEDNQVEEIMAGLSRAYRDDMLISEYDKLVKQASQAINTLIERHERRADYLNDALRRAAEFMHQNKLLPPDTTTVDGIRSYFLNEARFKAPQEDKL